MAQELEIAVRRARASDADTIAAFVNRALTGQAAVDRDFDQQLWVRLMKAVG